MVIGGQQAQLIQSADGQTYIYQPTIVDNSATLLHQPTGNFGLKILLFIVYMEI